MLFVFFIDNGSLFTIILPPGSWGVFACIHFCSTELCFGLQSTHFISCWKQVEQQKCLRCVDGGHATKRYSEDCHCQNKLLVKCLSLLASSQPFIIRTFQKHPSVSEYFTRNTPPPNVYGDACQSSFFPLNQARNCLQSSAGNPMFL